MSLTNPSPGELLDRLSIVKLKIAQGESLSRDVTYFEAERAEIVSRLGSIPFGHPDINRLFQVNELIWHETDALRELTKVQHLVAQQARLGVHILRLNDERAVLIERINREHGDFRKEKLA